MKYFLSLILALMITANANAAYMWLDDSASPWHWFSTLFAGQNGYIGDWINPDRD